MFSATLKPATRPPLAFGRDESDPGGRGVIRRIEVDAATVDGQLAGMGEDVA